MRSRRVRCRWVLHQQHVHRLGLDESVLWSALRCAGVRGPHEVSLVVVEPDGRFSVLKVGETVHPAALSGGRHSGELLDQLASAD